MTNTQKTLAVPALAAVVLLGGAMAGYASLASADTTDGSTGAPTHEMRGPGMNKGHGPHGHAMGQVTAIDGNTVTITGPDGTTITVDAAAATVEKVVEGSMADIQVGDRIGVHGTRTGTTVTAEKIITDLPEPPARPADAQ